MGQLLHGCARTTPATRRDIQNNKESLIKATQRFNVNPKTIAKWRKRTSMQFIHGPADTIHGANC